MARSSSIGVHEKKSKTMMKKFNSMGSKDIAIRALGVVLWCMSLVFFPKLWAITTILLAVFQLAKCHRISSRISKMVNKITPRSAK